MKITDALVVGLFQGCAIAPGLSRSGSTIFGSLICGLKRSEAAKFSFIISIPVILGAAAKEIFDVTQGVGGTIEWTYFLGAAVAAISGYAGYPYLFEIIREKIHALLLVSMSG